jgi:hypothetical protein
VGVISHCLTGLLYVLSGLARQFWIPFYQWKKINLSFMLVPQIYWDLNSLYGHILGSTNKLKLHSAAQVLNRLVGCKWRQYVMGGELSRHAISWYVLLSWTAKSELHLHKSAICVDQIWTFLLS